MSTSERFLVTIKSEDLEKLDAMAGRARISRNRYVLLAILAKLQTEPEECPLCGRKDPHEH